MDTLNPNQIIDRLGGTSETARLCEVQPASVSEWRLKGIPKARLMFLQAVRPEVFGLPRSRTKRAKTPKSV
jgi:hypothetical protein